MWIGILKYIRKSVEAFATIRIISEFFCQAIDIRQIVVIGKSLEVDKGHTVGNCDGEQAAIRKSRNADARHAVGGADGGQAGAFIEYTNY